MCIQPSARWLHTLFIRLKEWISLRSQLDERKGAKYSCLHKTPLAEYLVPLACSSLSISVAVVVMEVPTELSISVSCFPWFLFNLCYFSFIFFALAYYYFFDFFNIFIFYFAELTFYH